MIGECRLEEPYAKIGLVFRSKSTKFEGVVEEAVYECGGHQVNGEAVFHEIAQSAQTFGVIRTVN